MTSGRIDHVNIRVPTNGVDEAVEFYVDLLGFEPLELDSFRNGDRTSFFVRIGETSVINIRPVDSFEPPTGENFDHVCIVIDEPLDGLKRRLAANEVEVLREGTPLGATGRGPAVYVSDPFGYTVELKEALDR